MTDTRLAEIYANYLARIASLKAEGELVGDEDAADLIQEIRFGELAGLLQRLARASQSTSSLH